MKLLTLTLAVLFCACSSTPVTQDAGNDDSGFNDTPFLFNVSGTAAIFPEALPLLADAGVSTTVAGLRLRVEEPFRIALNDNDALGIFSDAILDAGGEFSASQVSTDYITLGVAAGVRDDTDAGRVVRTATTLWDVALEGKKPDHDLLSQKGWVIPTQLHDALTAAITPAQISTITAGADTTLIGAGFILGRIVDTTGAPVAGVTLTPTAVVAGQFFYPDATLKTTGAATSSNGLFVYVHNGGMVQTFRVNVTNHTEYKTRQAGATGAAGLVLTIYPGDTAP